MGADTSQLKGSPDAFKIKDLQSLSNLTPGYILKLKERFESSSDDYNLTRQGLKDYFKCRDNEIETVSLSAYPRLVLILDIQTF